jgi:hypothetical protein
MLQFYYARVVPMKTYEPYFNPQEKTMRTMIKKNTLKTTEKQIKTKTNIHAGDPMCNCYLWFPDEPNKKYRGLITFGECNISEGICRGQH